MRPTPESFVPERSTHNPAEAKHESSIDRPDDVTPIPLEGTTIDPLSDTPPSTPAARHSHLRPNDASDFDPVESPFARAEFGGIELATVLSHYDIGPIKSITPFTKGSRRAPKMQVRTDDRTYLLKRRSPGNSDPHRVALTHSVQLHLAALGFPVAPLIGTRKKNNSLLQIDENVYELFEFVTGRRYMQDRADALESGRTLGLMHRLIESHSSEITPPVGGFHRVDLEPHFSQLPRAVVSESPEVNIDDVRNVSWELREAYYEACEKTDALGYPSWRSVLVHGDWHPGNIIFGTTHVKAVLDFDTVRTEPRVAEVANAALQFAIRMGSADDPTHWPEGVSGHRTVNLVAGFNQFASAPLTPEEMQAIPWLMIEALIAESVVPIAMTGRFARIDGAPFLEMVAQKVRWLTPRAGILVKHLMQSARPE